jgi:hypothetical protein
LLKSERFSPQKISPRPVVVVDACIPDAGDTAGPTRGLCQTEAEPAAANRARQQRSAGPAADWFCFSHDLILAAQAMPGLILIK